MPRPHKETPVPALSAAHTLADLIRRAQDAGAYSVAVMPPGRPRMNLHPEAQGVHWHELPTVPGSVKISASRLRVMLLEALGESALRGLEEAGELPCELEVGGQLWSGQVVIAEGLLVVGLGREAPISAQAPAPGRAHRA